MNAWQTLAVMKNKIVCGLLIVPIFVSGCFTAANSIGDGGGGATPATVALDVFTLPAQAVIIPPALAVDAHNEKVAKRNLEERTKADRLFMSMLERDPSTGLKERWDLKNDIHSYVFKESFSNTNVNYTDDLLENIYQTCPSIRSEVFSCLYCSTNLLARHFDEEFKQVSVTQFPRGLELMIKNPNMPTELLEKVASSNNDERSVAAYAKAILTIRQRKLMTQPTNK